MALVSRRDQAPLLITLALFAARRCLSSFYDGHPYRIRYMIPIVAACALFCGLLWSDPADPPGTVRPFSLSRSHGDMKTRRN